MQTTLQKWGNSQGIRVPKYVLTSLNLAENDILEIKTENEQIIIARLNQKKKEHKRAFYKLS